MIKVTLEFETVEHTIVALGKLAAVAKVRRAASALSGGAPVAAPEDLSAQAEPAAPTAGVVQNLTLPDTTRSRKGRADKGQKRGPHKPATQEAAVAVPQERTYKADTLPPEVAPADAHKAEPSGVVPPAAAAASPAPTEADAQKALETLFESAPESSVGIQKAKDILAQFGVRRVRELKVEDRAEFIKKATLASAKAV